MDILDDTFKQADGRKYYEGQGVDSNLLSFIGPSLGTPLTAVTGS
jgi:hypothetical protein